VFPECDDEGRIVSAMVFWRRETTVPRLRRHDSLTWGYDSLTGFLNREHFLCRLDESISAFRTNDKGLVVVQIGISDFELISKVSGREATNRLLCEMAGRLQAVVRRSDLVARISTEVFAVLVQNTLIDFDHAAFARKVLSAIVGRYRMKDRETLVNVGIGVAVCPEDGATVESILKNVGSSLSFAKERGPNQICRFSAEQSSQFLDELDLAAGIARALESEEFELHYQPQLELNSGRISGLEALIRWNHPRLGLLSPGRFIATAEKYGLIRHIGRWVATNVCDQVRRWRDQGICPGRVALNLSASQFQDDEALDFISSEIVRFGIHGSDIEIEITETAAVCDIDRTASVIHRLNAIGISVAIDDFGTGYSSLSYLKDFPISRIKIDKAFVDGMQNNPNGQEIVSVIVNLSHSLGLTAVAEGVEERSQLEFLRRLGCDVIQGYYISKPLDSANVALFLLKTTRLSMLSDVASVLGSP